jgi:hypothetical protein
VGRGPRIDLYDLLARFAPLNRSAEFMPLQSCQDCGRRNGMNAALRNSGSRAASMIPESRIGTMNQLGGARLCLGGQAARGSGDDVGWFRRASCGRAAATGRRRRSRASVHGQGKPIKTRLLSPTLLHPMEQREKSGSLAHPCGSGRNQRFELSFCKPGCKNTRFLSRPD